MSIVYDKPKTEDIEPIFLLCKQLIDDYENKDAIDYDRVLKWVHKKIETSIAEYTVVYSDGNKAGYYHFYKNNDGEYEIDDLYIFPEFQNRGIGSEIIKRCCSAVDAPVMLYVFIKKQRAISLYQKLGFKIDKTVGDSRYIMRKENR
jgi:ribosomal protein S18 acetylase RimI-like enzyme